MICLEHSIFISLPRGRIMPTTLLFAPFQFFHIPSALTEVCRRCTFCHINGKMKFSIFPTRHFRKMQIASIWILMSCVQCGLSMNISRIFINIYPRNIYPIGHHWRSTLCGPSKICLISRCILVKNCRQEGGRGQNREILPTS